MATPSKGKSLLEVSLGEDLDELITEAARHLNVTKAAFVSEAIRDGATKVIARADFALMDAGQFDAMMGSIDTAGESGDLAALAALPRHINT